MSRDIVRLLVATQPKLVLDKHVPYVPPSLNRAYQIVRIGSRHTLSKTKALKEFVSSADKVACDWSNVKDNPTDAYLLRIDFTFKALTCKGWPKKAKSFWRRIDTSNRIKHAEDLVSKHVGVDDSKNVMLFITKSVGEEGMRVRLYKVTDYEGFIDGNIE